MALKLAQGIDRLTGSECLTGQMGLVRLSLGKQTPLCASLIVGTLFAGHPLGRNALSGIPQLRLFKDGDVLGNLKPEFLEQGDARRVLISDSDDQRFLRDWQRRLGIRSGGVRKHQLQSEAGKPLSTIFWL